MGVGGTFQVSAQQGGREKSPSHDHHTHIGTKQGHSKKPRWKRLQAAESKDLGSNPSSVYSVLRDWAWLLQNGCHQTTFTGGRQWELARRCLSVLVCSGWPSLTSSAPERPIFPPMVPPSGSTLVLQAKTVACGPQFLPTTSQRRGPGHFLRSLSCSSPGV